METHTKESNLEWTNILDKDKSKSRTRQDGGSTTIENPQRSVNDIPYTQANNPNIR